MPDIEISKKDLAILKRLGGANWFTTSKESSWSPKRIIHELIRKEACDEREYRRSIENL
jgi:hypothetical protein